MPSKIPISKINSIRDEYDTPIVYNLPKDRLALFVEDVKKEDATEESLAEKWLSPALKHMGKFVVVMLQDKRFIVGKELYEKIEPFFDSALTDAWVAYLKLMVVDGDVKKPMLLDYTEPEILMLAETGGAILDGNLQNELVKCGIRGAPERKEEFLALHNDCMNCYEDFSCFEHTHYMYNTTRVEFSSMYRWIKEQKPDSELIEEVVLPSFTTWGKSDCVVKGFDGRREMYGILKRSEWLVASLLNPVVNFQKLFDDDWYLDKDYKFKEAVQYVTSDVYEMEFFGMYKNEEYPGELQDIFFKPEKKRVVLSPFEIAEYIEEHADTHTDEDDIMEVLSKFVNKQTRLRVQRELDQMKPHWIGFSDSGSGEESSESEPETPPYKKRKVTFADDEPEEIMFSALSEDEVEKSDLKKQSEKAATELNKIKDKTE